jgi:YesN/AraC family two-component response regulator
MAPRHGRPVVLVVDDDPAVRESLLLVLDDEFDTLEAADAATALAIVGAGPVDLVLLDILMPRADGLQLLEQLHRVRPGIPVVVLSGLDKAAIAAAAMRLGAVDYLTKPFQDRMLLDSLRAVVHRNGRRPRISGTRPLVLLIGCDPAAVAGMTALLRENVEIETCAELPPDPSLLSVARPIALVVETSGRRMSALTRAALLLEHFSPAPSVVVVREPGSDALRFAFGSRHVVLEQPPTLTAVLDPLCALVPGPPPAQRPWRDQRTAAVINAVFADGLEFRLRSVANRIGTSPRYLSRAFMQHAGMSVGTYLTTVRVHMAAFLLRHTDMKIDAIAGMVGFHDASHVSRAFVRVTGRRPGQFRAEPMAG